MGLLWLPWWFLGYASNKYKDAAKKENNGYVGDDFIIKKVSNGRFQNLEEWKSAWYHEVHEKAQKGFVEIEINGEKISTYARLQELFDEAVEKILKVMDLEIQLVWKRKFINNFYKNLMDLLEICLLNSR